MELPSTRGNGILDPIPPYLRERIAEQDLAGPVARRFGQELERLAQIDGRGFDPVEAVLITRLVTESPGDVVVPAPFDALWPHAGLFLSACLYVAVSDGRYTVEQARYVSRLANRLGWSARQFSELEAMVLCGLVERGREIIRATAT